jgi:hypothetical protein
MSVLVALEQHYFQKLLNWWHSPFNFGPGLQCWVSTEASDRSTEVFFPLHNGPLALGPDKHSAAASAEGSPGSQVAVVVNTTV